MVSIRVLNGEEVIQKRIKAGDVSLLGELGQYGGFLTSRDYKSFKALERFRIGPWQKPGLEEVGLLEGTEAALRSLGVLSANGLGDWLRMAPGSSHMRPDMLAEINEKYLIYKPTR